jgi:hypothetical protein
MYISKSKCSLKTRASKNAMEFENDTMFICANQFVPLQTDRYAHGQSIVLCTNTENELLTGIIYNNAHTVLTLRSCAVFCIVLIAPCCLFSHIQ